MNFNVPPEFSEPGVITVEQALQMSYNGGHASATYSLLYPANMHAEYFTYITTGAFKYLDETQTNYFHDWFTEQLAYNGEQAQGTFIAKSIESAGAFLTANFNAEASARNMGYYNVNLCATCSDATPATQDCTYYMSQAVTDAAQVASICQEWDFSNLADLRLFVNGIMKGTSADVATTVGLTTAEMDAFNDASTPGQTGSFGEVLAWVRAT